MRIILIRSTEVMPDPPVEKIAEELITEGHKVTILAWDRSNCYRGKVSVKKLASCETDIVHFGIPAEYCGGIKKNFRALLLFQFRILHWLSRHHKEFDAVHAFDFDTGFASMLCCKVFRKKFIYHILDYYVDGHILAWKFLNPIVEFFEIRVINAADVTIICTEKRAEQISKSSPKKLCVIHNTPSSLMQPNESFALQSSSGKMKLAYVGILAGGRLLKETVEAISQMKNIEMHIGGFGELDSWMQNAAERYENVFYYGRLQYSDTLALEKKCDIMIAAYDPSQRNHKYAAPNKFYESIMLGKPIIMANDTGYDDVIKENDIGCLTEFSQDGIRNALHTLESRRADWPSMGDRARELYKSTYSWEIMRHRIQEIYQDVQTSAGKELHTI